MFRSSASTLALVTLAALAAGCQNAGDDQPQSVPATTGGTPTAGATPTVLVAPTASASPSVGTAANTAAVCRAVDQLIIDGSRRIAVDSSAATERELTPEQLNGQLNGSLARLADDVRDEGAKAEDPRIRRLLTDVAGRLDAGAEATSPAKWMQTSFVDIPQRLTRDCHV
ncbi:hypothetical protein [Micromonospora sp. DT47]|uniref:hypothetical protein n=1 Tax=Micromonospora sp. DT47 TaxID=3393431 RepID=UPI003CED54B0